MRNITRAIGVSIAATALVAGTAISASAEPTVVTFEVTGGALAIAPAETAVLTTVVSGTTSVSGGLGDVIVTDARGGNAGWVVEASSEEFSNALGTVSTAVQYAPGAIADTGEVTVAGVDAALTGTAVEVVTATAVIGNNTATWSPTLTVTLPDSSTAGNYEGTVTTSVA